MKFFKYHALGNDYIVLNPGDVGDELTSSQIRSICHRNYGIGSDGILFGPFISPQGDFVLRIFNPDGSEAEKSGNGLRIFSRYLWDKGLVQERPFIIMTAGGKVISQVHKGGKNVRFMYGKCDKKLTTINKYATINRTFSVLGSKPEGMGAHGGQVLCVR